MKKLTILILLLATIQVSFAKEFSVKSKKAIRLYKDAEIILAYNGDYARGIFTLRHLVKEYPEFVEAYLLLGDAYGNVHRYEAQKKCYLKVAELVHSDPRHVTMYYTLANIFYKEKNYNKALVYIGKIEQYKYASKEIYEEAITLKVECEGELLKLKEQRQQGRSDETLVSY